MLIVRPSKIRYHAYSNGVIWASRKRSILTGPPGGDRWKKLLNVPGQHLAVMPVLARMSRQGIAHVIPLSAGQYVVMVRGALLFFRERQLIHVRRLAGGSHPLRQGICYLDDIGLIYGDYWSNPRRLPVGLHLTTDFGETWETVWISDPGSHRHVHCVIPDRRNPRSVYFSTGDVNAEPALFHLDLDSRILRRIGGGDPDWRMVSLLQISDFLVWGTDNERGPNHILRYQPAGGELARLRPVAGPCYYSVSDGTGAHHLATTIESRRHHRACVYSSRNGLEWTETVCYKKDLWPSRWFGYGIIEWIRGQRQLNDLYLNTRGLC